VLFVRRSQGFQFVLEIAIIRITGNGLVEVTGPTTPWFPGGLVAELEEFLGRRVDIVEPDAIREPLRREILQDAVPL